jgi:TatD DNase family protein
VLVDTHCHLNDPSFKSTLSGVLSAARAAGVFAFIVPAYDGRSLARTAELADSFPREILPAFGIHPWFAGEMADDGRLLAFLRRSDTVAVGEIGLDLSPECPSQELQVRALIRQLDWARDLGLPVALHCRKAYDPLYEILGGYRGRVRGVLHSYSGTEELMFRFIEMGYYISFSGAMTRTTAKKYHKNAHAVPLDRLLVETDAPSIATETTVASEVEPRHVVEVARKIAEIRNIPFEEVCDRSTENARRLFRIP